MDHDPIDVDVNSLKVSSCFQDLSMNSSSSSTSLDLCSSTSTITVSDNTTTTTSSTSCFSKWSADEFVEKRMDEDEDEDEDGEEEEEEEEENLELSKSEESGKSSSFSSASYSNNGNGMDVNESSFRSYCSSKPHKGNDIRWDAIQSVMAKDGGELGLGHFRLLKKLGFGDIGSVYLAELRGMGCLFAMKVMDKGMLAGRKKLVRAQTEREILALLDHPFLPTLYSHFETDKFSCLLMEFCSGGDLHLLRQRQPGRHFSEQAARLAFLLASSCAKYRNSNLVTLLFYLFI